MIKFNELKKAELEITSRCQAACPMCSRNIRGGGENENLKINDWTIEDFNTIMTVPVLMQLEEILFCGCYGDPILNNDLLSMVKQIVKINPKLRIEFNTNGSARKKEWWAELGSVLKDQPHRISFGIDGLADTHSLYRINTHYEKILDNAKTFIDAGGDAGWQFILFKHNEHQVDEARRISKSLGFRDFIFIDTYRFSLSDKFDVYDDKGNITHTLEKSDKSNIVRFPDEAVINYREILDTVEITCAAKKDGGIYIDANYHLYPCCFIAGTMYNSYNYFEPLGGSNEAVNEAWRVGHREVMAQNHNVVKQLGGFDTINLKKVSLEEILSKPTYTDVWESQWTGCNKNLQCAGICGKKLELDWSTSTDQYAASITK